MYTSGAMKALSVEITATESKCQNSMLKLPISISLTTHSTQIAKELKITPILDKLLEYKRKWI